MLVLICTIDFAFQLTFDISMDNAGLVNILERDSDFSCNGNDVLLSKTRLWSRLHQRSETAARTILSDDPKLGIHRKGLEDCVDILGAVVLE